MKLRFIIITGFFMIMFLSGIGMFTPAALSAEETLTKDKNWEFNLAPLYLWVLNVDGSLTAKGITQNLEADFGQITDNLEQIFTIHFEGMHKSGWGFLTDGAYLNFGGQQDIPFPPVTIDVDFTMVMVELAGIYRLGMGANALDFIGGVRYYGLEPKIDVVGQPPEFNENQDWVDAMLGARYIWYIADKWDLMARGDIGLGGSKFAWNLAALLKFQPWKYVSFVGGYRYMDVDYEDGSGEDLFRYDVSINGPILGVNFVW